MIVRIRYEAFFANIGLSKIPISDEVVKEHPKLLSGGVWCILTMGYVSTDEKKATPWVVEQIKPIQISNIDIEEFKSMREINSPRMSGWIYCFKQWV